jgi:hypothetical protein
MGPTGTSFSPNATAGRLLAESRKLTRPRLPGADGRRSTHRAYPYLLSLRHELAEYCFLGAAVGLRVMTKSFCRYRSFWVGALFLFTRMTSLVCLQNPYFEYDEK